MKTPWKCFQTRDNMPYGRCLMDDALWGLQTQKGKRLGVKWFGWEPVATEKTPHTETAATASSYIIAPQAQCCQFPHFFRNRLNPWVLVEILFLVTNSIFLKNTDVTSAFYCSVNKHRLNAYWVPGSPSMGCSDDRPRGTGLLSFCGADGTAPYALSCPESVANWGPELPWELVLLADTFT